MDSCLHHVTNGGGDDVQALGKLLLCDYQWWCKPDNVTVCRLCQESSVSQLDADVPGILTW